MSAIPLIAAVGMSVYDFGASWQSAETRHVTPVRFARSEIDPITSKIRSDTKLLFAPIATARAGSFNYLVGEDE